MMFKSRSKLFSRFVSGAVVSFFLMATILPATTSFAEAKKELVIFNWEEYIDPELVTEFEESTGASVVIVPFNSDDERNRILSENDGAGFDLILISGKDLHLFTHQDIFTEPDSENIPNLVHIDPKWSGGFDGSRQFGVPYFWGTLGIAYRKDLYPQGIESWKEFFDPSPELHGKISLIQSSRDLFGMALKSLGYSINTNDPQHFLEAHAVLEKQKPHVKTYEYLVTREESPLVTGEVWMTLMYNGDALMQQDQNENIEFVIPREGSYLWVDYFVISKKTQQKELAEKFLNFLNEPESAAQNAEYLYYATPNISAWEHVSEEYQKNQTIHPTEAVLNKSETLQALQPRVQKKLNGLFADIVD